MTNRSPLCRKIINSVGLETNQIRIIIMKLRRFLSPTVCCQLWNPVYEFNGIVAGQVHGSIGSMLTEKNVTLHDATGAGK
jgi:hypothetical protein